MQIHRYTGTKPQMVIAVPVSISGYECAGYLPAFLWL